ncbi:MAG: NAD(P)H-dependent oxidoreductase subunit E, partial [Dehalococcoidia bacterium]|nr:NAD(P)H-dependent oxidoreductase subunit E [Dehalococcoidia bacterium]
MSAASKESSSSIANRAELLPVLKQEMGKNGSLSKTVLASLADKTGIPLNEIYGVSTFYSYLPVAAVGKNIIRVCGCLPCDLKDAQGVIGSIKKELGIGPGETTSDGKFTLEIAGCIGACDQAPAMLINDKLY